MAGRHFRSKSALTGSSGKLGWRRPSADDGKTRLRFDEAVFKVGPFPYRRCQKKKDKEDRQSQGDLIKAVICGRYDGNRQQQDRRDNGDHNLSLEWLGLGDTVDPVCALPSILQICEGLFCTASFVTRRWS